MVVNSSSINHPFVSIIIPTYNREKCLAELVHALFIQDYLNHEVIVIDQSEVISQQKKELVASYGPHKLRYYHLAEKGRSLAKNFGISVSTGEILLFCDDDIFPSKDFVRVHLQNYNNKLIGAVSCRLVEEGQEGTSIRKPLWSTFYGRFINKPYSTFSSYVTSLNGGNMSIRKSVVDKCGYFEEMFIGTSMVEEPDYAYRILRHGYKIYFDASTTVLHIPQNDGNAASMQRNRTNWFYNFFYNLAIYFMKYGRLLNIPFALLYCVVLSSKQCVVNRLRFRDFIGMVSGFFSGLQKGYQIYQHPSRELFFTPFRSRLQTTKSVDSKVCLL